jgi:UDP-N-acetyl-D-mannosaminuronate dehydrogenase
VSATSGFHRWDSCPDLLRRSQNTYNLLMENINTPDSGRKVAGYHARNSLGDGLKTSYDPAKVLIIGLGQLGLPVAKYVLERGFDTYGYDISVKAMERAEKTAGIKRALDFGSEDFDVFIISVSTHQPDNMFSPLIDGLLSIAHKISKEAKKDGALVSIESTIPKGTSKQVFEILNHRLHVVQAPHRWYSVEEKEMV